MSDETKPQEHTRPSSEEMTSKRKKRRLSGWKKGSRLKSSPPPNSIRYYRKNAHLSLAELGNRLGVRGETIRRLEERDTWLNIDRAAEIGVALGIPKEILGFSDAPDAYAWAAKAVPVIGSVIADDEVRYRNRRHRIAGAPTLPSDVVALDIQQGKMKGWFLFCRSGVREPMSNDVLRRQGRAEKFIVNLKDGTAWWRHIIASQQNLYHLTSPHLRSVSDAEISWVFEIVGFDVPLFDLPNG